ncbi:MAG TPA: Gfo/Idh/MocA family oxidoreductase [Spirochaetia bacterium]|nr:Gfo/Idh/MocA family oxidoreductase [Spirochaetia bacterium]
MSSKRYRVVVAGMGKRGVHHASAFHTNPRFEVVGIADPDPSRLSEAGKFGSPKTSADAAALARELSPDVFCFCTPPTIRYDLVKAGVDSGARLIAFEKPLAMSSGEGMRIRDLLDAKRVKAVVSHQHRYGEHYRKVAEIISGGSLGRVHSVYGTATGWMLHMASHLIDYMRWYNGGAEALWVMAQASGRGKLTDLHASPDYIAGFIQFANGVHGVLECGAGAPDVPEADAWWRKCRIGAQGTDGFAEVLTGAGWRTVTRSGASSGPGNMDYDHDMPPYVQEMADWLDDDARLHSCNFGSAYKGHEILMGLVRSAVLGGQVALPLGSGMNETLLLKEKLGNAKAIPSFPGNAKEYA